MQGSGKPTPSKPVRPTLHKTRKLSKKMDEIREKLGLKSSVKLDIDPEESLQDNIRNNFDTLATSYDKPFKDILEDIGFTKRHTELYLKITKDLDSYSNHQLIDIIIEYATGKYEPIAPPTKPFLFENEPEVFFEQMIEGKPVKTMNCTRSKLPDLQQHIGSLGGDSLLYHAASWSGALSIVKDGPLTTIGRKCLDFGMTPSFYMSLNIDIAVDMALKQKHRWHNELAIVIFRPIKLDKEKIFASPDQEWKQLTGLSRQCKVNSLDKLKYIYGPMVSNAADASIGKPPRTHNPIKYQVAVKGSKATKELAKNILCVLFIQKT